MASVSGAGASPVGGVQQTAPIERIPVSPMVRTMSLLLQRGDVLGEIATDQANRLKEEIDKMAKGRDIAADIAARKKDDTQWMSQDMQDFFTKYDVQAADNIYITESQTKSNDDRYKALFGRTYYDNKGKPIPKEDVTWDVAGKHEKPFAYDSSWRIHKDQWDVNKQYLQAKLDSWSTDQSVLMQEMKGTISKKDEATDGANSFVSQLHQSRSGLNTPW